jgi:hypothetical protein
VAKLTAEQQEALAELKNSDGVKPLLLELENRLEVIERDVLQHVLDGKDTSERELLYRKMRYEGAQKFYRELKAILAKGFPKHE